jgi:hypothetical protein
VRRKWRGGGKMRKREEEEMEGKAMDKEED